MAKGDFVKVQVDAGNGAAREYVVTAPALDNVGDWHAALVAWLIVAWISWLHPAP